MTSVSRVKTWIAIAVVTISVASAATKAPAKKPAAKKSAAVVEKSPDAPATSDIHVAFGLDGVLVTQIPSSLVSELPAAEVFTAGGHNFRINTDAARVFEHLLKENPAAKLSVYGTRSRDETLGILNHIQISGHALTSDLEKVLGKEDLAFAPGKNEKSPEPTAGREPLSSKYRKDPAKVSAAKDSVIFVESDAELAPKSHVIDLGPSRYYFKTADAAHAAYEARLKKDAEEKEKFGDKYDSAVFEAESKRYPKDEESWSDDRGRLDRAYSVLSRTLPEAKKSKASIPKLLSQYQSEPFSKSIATAQHELSRYVTWDLDDSGKKVQGCVEKSDEDKDYSKKVDFSLCLRAASTHYAWSGENEDICTRSTDKDIFLSHEDKSVCLKKLPIPHVYWADDNMKSCGAFTSKNVFLGVIDLSYCEGLRMICNPHTGVLSSSQKLLINGVLQSLIPEILKLKDNEVVPQEVYSKYSSKLIGASIVARKHQADEPEANDKSGFDYYKNGEIQMAFQEAYIESIEKNCFLNQHQVDHTGGYNGPPRRAQAEDAMARVHLEANYRQDHENPANKVRPKYAGFGLKDNTAGRSNLESIAPYGNVLAVMKDAVKDRTTFSPNDSLGNPGYTFTLGYRASHSDVRSGGGYWEAQIWGEVCMNDVDHFLVNCFGHGSVTAAAIEKLKVAGPPVYECGGQEPGGAFKPGARIK